MKLIASYGGGVNSTAMLIGLRERDVIPDLILFADTGGETPETYEFVSRFSKWLIAHDMPPIQTVVKTTKRAGRFRGANEVLTLERRCLEEKVLPSIAYGYKTCSLKFKKEPQESFLRENFPDEWKRSNKGSRFLKFMGYDASEPQRADKLQDDRFDYRYPLIEWGWDREECVEAITNAGLCVPPKSSCYFCPNMDELEILQLRDRHPDLLQRALDMEANAVSTHGSSIKGLGRDVSWKQIIEYDAAQMAFIPRSLPKRPCECWDG